MEKKEKRKATPFAPEQLAANVAPVIVQSSSTDPATASWKPLFRHDCGFGPDVFWDVMENLVKNPNINSTWLFRADILHDTGDDCSHATTSATPTPAGTPSIPSFAGFELTRSLVRRLIPRNTQRDSALDQTCAFYDGSFRHDGDAEHGVRRSLVVYLPHVSSPSEMPFYHPKVRGIAYLHEWSPEADAPAGSISLSYLYYSDSDASEDRLTRTALQLLKVVYKHGQGRVAGYQKRVHHDVLLPQARVQDTYTRLKQKYARSLIESWAETTDPEKHVFEDLCIAAFLVELWADMYGPSQCRFPGFVDIGCGNGLLVYILNQEGFAGWGFDARSRKSWKVYNTKLQRPAGEEDDSLKELVLLPPPVGGTSTAETSSDGIRLEMFHDGRFPKGTFIISNHADELTPWTPILAALSECPFIAIPCCSHNLRGDRFRAPAPKDKSKADSTYASLVVWVAQIARDCGWVVEQEMLRIPSTRNAAIVGRRRSAESAVMDMDAIVERYGGTAGYLENALKLVARDGGPPASDHE